MRQRGVQILRPAKRNWHTTSSQNLTSGTSLCHYKDRHNKHNRKVRKEGFRKEISEKKEEGGAREKEGKDKGVGTEGGEKRKIRKEEERRES